MTELRISLTPALRSFVDQQVAAGGYATPGDYVRELIQREQDREKLRRLLLEGASSAVAGPADAAWFRRLRRRARGLHD